MVKLLVISSLKTLYLCLVRAEFISLLRFKWGRLIQNQFHETIFHNGLITSLENKVICFAAVRHVAALDQSECCISDR